MPEITLVTTPKAGTDGAAALDGIVKDAKLGVTPTERVRRLRTQLRHVGRQPFIARRAQIAAERLAQSSPPFRIIGEKHVIEADSAGACRRLCVREYADYRENLPTLERTGCGRLYSFRSAFR